jgi:hypothetical protein
MVHGGEQGETWRLRRGKEVRVRDDALLIEGVEDETIRVELDDVVEVSRRSVDWFTGVLSVVLVGLGLLLTQDSIVGGLALAAAGAGSVYLTYRRRDETNLRIRGRTKPLQLYPANGDRFYEGLGRLLEVEEARREENG